MTRPALFEILAVEVDVEAQTVTGRWAIGDDCFTETAVIPEGDLSLPGVAEAAELWCLLAGVSYFKTAAPLAIDLGPISTTAAQRAFLQRFYVAGLGEFALGNGLDLTGLTINGRDGDGPTARVEGDPGRVLIPFGGGLDSIVTVSELEPQADDVPVTGMLSALAVLAAAATGRGAVAMSNERSASSATTHGPHGPVNHQWSKGLEFEIGFRSLVEQRVGNIAYFSWLRDRSELSIAAVLASLDAYLPLFRSCNRSFHQDPERRLATWCGVCDKCLFIDLVLAPFLPPETLAKIFGGTEPLVQSALAGQLRVLVGMSEETRPFECVGDEEECREALLRTAARPDRATEGVLHELAREVAMVHRRSDPPAPAAVIPERYAPPPGLE